jgi:cell wall-associated NlpC family hydrolase
MPDNRFFDRYAFALNTAIRWLVPCSIIFALIVIAGCGATPAKPLESLPHNAIESKLRKAARHWHRTPHRLGGLDRRGIDCSGLVKVLYDDLFHIELPRTTRLQARQGRAVASGQWTAGDLLFFKPEDKGSHVGIYLANHEFLHATTRRGVIVSNLSEPYWHKSYWKARRLLKHHSSSGAVRQ